MKQLGNLAIVCANRRNTLLQILDGIATVHVGNGPTRTMLAAEWHDDLKIMEIIMELNHGRFREECATTSALRTGAATSGEERDHLYDELSALLTNYEGNGSDTSVRAEDLYRMLVRIQNNWESVIAASEQ